MTTKRSRRRKARNSRKATHQQVWAGLDALEEASRRYVLSGHAGHGDRYVLRILDRACLAPSGGVDPGMMATAKVNLEFFNTKEQAKAFVRYMTAHDIITAALRVKP